MSDINKNDVYLNEVVKDGEQSSDRSLTHVNSTWDELNLNSELDRRVTRKFDYHIVPWLFGLWLLAFIDRSNIGNARIDGLATDLKLTTDKFNIALAVFYVPYICVDVPSNWVLKYFKAGYYLPALLLAWGIVSTCTGFVKTYKGLLIARAFLGLTEGGLLGGMIIYLAMFYRRHQLLYRIGLFYCAAPLSGAFGGLLAAGLTKIHTKNYKGWPFIFFVEGAITIAYGLICIWFLPHTPEESKFLSAEERQFAIDRMRADGHGASDGQVSREEFSWRWVKMAIFNWNTILLSLNFFAIITPIYSYSLFLPTIIKNLGYTSIHAQLLTVPPNICGFITVLITGYFSDKLRMRGPLMITGAAISAIGYIVLITQKAPIHRYGGTFLAAAGIFPCSPLVMGWLANNLAPHYVRATGTGFQIMVANLAAFIATFTYLPADAPRYTTGHSINLGFLCLSICLSTILILYNKGENKKRAEGKRDGRLLEGDESQLGYRHPSFVYTI